MKNLGETQTLLCKQMTPGDVSTVTPQRVNPEDRTGRKMDRAWLPGYTPEPLHLPPVEPSHPDFL